MTATGVNFTFDIDHGIRQVVADIESISWAIRERAVRRAIRKFQRIIKRRAMQALSASSGVPQNVFDPDRRGRSGGEGDRLRVFASEKNGVLVVWIGANPVPAHLLAGRAGVSKARYQRRRGVRIKKRFFESAFVASIHGDGAKVWRRKYRGKGASAMSGSLAKELRGRFPVEVMKTEIAADVSVLAAALRSEMQDRLLRLLQQEINYAVNHERHR